MSDEDHESDPGGEGGGGPRITTDEAREAEALAAALERGRATDALPEDALETAALLRYAQGSGELSREREDAVLAELFETGKPRAAEEKKPASLRWLAWLVPMGGLAAAAAAFLVLATFTGQESPAADTAARTGTELPAPSAELVRAQLAVASGEAELRELSEPMRGYRSAMLAALDGRYGGR